MSVSLNLSSIDSTIQWKMLLSTMRVRRDPNIWAVSIGYEFNLLSW